ncbi:MAG: hypothetical protein H0X36_01530 [Sphingomonadaceae bacterium]|nr:hypothetical protein [Sphingomonadaceae bacterium]
MSRHELRPLTAGGRTTCGVVGWDRPLQTFFAQLFSLNEEGEDQAHIWVGTFPRELDSAAAAIAIVKAVCETPDGLAATLETERLASPELPTVGSRSA